MDSIFLYDLQCPKPEFQKSQNDCIQWLSEAYQFYQSTKKQPEGHYDKLLGRVGVPQAQINKRNYFLPDFHRPLSDAQIFSSEQKGISERQTFFSQTTLQVLREIYQHREIPSHLIHVTCTGYVSPSAAQILAAEKSPETLVTHCYHMGCYGAFPALRMASGFLHSSKESLSEKSEVDVIHTELCTLHLNPQNPSLEKILVQTLFADGISVYRLGRSQPRAGFELLDFTEYLIPQSQEAMTWGISEKGFEMTLSKDVPSLIRLHLRSSLEKWEKKSSAFRRQDLKEAIVAVHPGGPKIIDFIKEELELKEAQVKYSRTVLRENGNMSSATVPHIWNQILDDSQVVSGTLVVSMAFGPGLTMCLSLMRVI